MEAEKSIGHLCFAGQFEFYTCGGSVYRAKHADPVMTDGRRCGRRECATPLWDKFGPMLVKSVR